jgi:hypothetical protein
MAWYDGNPFLQLGDRFWNGANPITGAPQDWYDTPEVRDDPNNPSAPQGEFERFLTSQGFGGFDRKSQFGRSLFGRANSAFDAAQLSNPGLTWRKFLTQLGNRNFLDQAYASVGTQARGAFNPSQTRIIRQG